jgi:EAL and modified HD-GYP domain-containing signal transduction protein
VELLRPRRVQLVAEKVETQDDLDRCRSLGFDFLQGYFFCKPRTLEGRAIAPSRLSRLQLLASLNDPDVELEELSAIVERDIGLSYRLLRYVNSAHVGLPNQVDSIRRALVLIGLNKLRSWANLFALGQIDDAPSELLTTAMARARMCELLAAQLRLPPQTAFTVGLFSVLDALMNQDMADVLEQLPLSDELNDALLYRRGEFGDLLARVLAYEAGTLDGEGLEMCDQYIEAIAWTDQARSLVRAA